MKCTLCGSHAINDHLHSRTPGVDTHLCDVCYWRTRTEKAQAKLQEYGAFNDDALAYATTAPLIRLVRELRDILGMSQMVLTLRVVFLPPLMGLVHIVYFQQFVQS